jgi:hypothetical protein
VLLRRAFFHHRHRRRVVDVDIVLVCANVHVIAGLKITDPRRAPKELTYFGRIRDRDGGNRLVVGFDDDILVPDVPQYPGERLAVDWRACVGPPCGYRWPGYPPPGYPTPGATIWPKPGKLASRRTISDVNPRAIDPLDAGNSEWVAKAPPCGNQPAAP